MTLALILAAAADTITLDTGAVIEGDLARYEFGGDCQVSVTEGDLTGVILIVPCHRVQSFMRTQVRVPTPIGAGEAPAAGAPVVLGDLPVVAPETGGDAEAPEVAPAVAAAPAPVEPAAAPERSGEDPFGDGFFATSEELARQAEATAPVAATPAVVETAPRAAPEMGSIEGEDAEGERKAVRV